jgi:hypothetical protein
MIKCRLCKQELEDKQFINKLGKKVKTCALCRKSNNLKKNDCDDNDYIYNITRIHYKVKQIIEQDKKQGQYNPNTFVDASFIYQELINNNFSCKYCTNKINCNTMVIKKHTSTIQHSKINTYLSCGCTPSLNMTKTFVVDFD